MSDLPFLTEEKDMAEEVAAPEQAEAQPEPEPKGEPEPAAPPAAQPEEPKHVPLTALLDEREKRQKIERERDEAMQRLQAFQAQQQPKDKPDIFTDPEAVIAQIRQEAAMQARQVKLELSQELAVKEFGQDLVAEAYAFFDAPENRHMTHQFAGHASPFHAAVQHYKQIKAMQEIGPDPEAWKAKQLEALRAEILAQAVPSAPKAPPPSMAATPGSGGGKEPPASGFASLFERE